jgi:3-oxoadipate enol-lactonase
MNLRVQADDGASLAAEIRGRRDHPALLFLNSIGCDRRLWDAQVHSLETDYLCLLFDARGHGQSDAPDGDYSLARLGKDALHVLDRVQVERAEICGLSLGGLVAQWLAIHESGRVGRLVLANTGSRIGSRESWETRRRTVHSEGMQSIAALSLERFFSPGFRAASPEVVDRFRATLLNTPAAGYAGCCGALRDADLTAEIGGITAPTVVLGGQEDVSTPPSQAQALASAIPGAKLQMLRAAHLSNVEQPAAFTAALRAHLEGSHG